ncbi:MAG: ECF transporter S component [Eubacteriales bacterium]|nr:ECF transporter S component [Eubacteriales bacterium]
MTKTKKLTLAAMFFAVGLILPFFIGQIPAVGQMLLPMHIPVLLCGLIAGWEYGLVVGFFLPLTRGVLFGMPALYPNGIGMAFELATYGLVIGYLYGHSRWQCVRSLYRCMIAAMVAGRLVWGAVRVVLLGVGGAAFSWELFLAGALLNAIPGIVLQLVMIPAVMVSLNRAKIVPFRKAGPQKARAQAGG